MSMSSGNEASKNRGSTTTTAEREATQARPEDRPGGQESRSVQEMGATGVALRTDTGTTRIADSVVAKIAGLAARDIPGVFAMGTGMARRVGQLRSLIPGSSDSSGATQGVAVEVGEREAAIDLNLVTWYGQSIVDISDAVRRNVIGQVEGMTGLKVVEINIQIDDIHVETDDGSQKDQPQRVQ
jgi:uncharacterized alkaline shock family protein YloU